MDDNLSKEKPLLSVRNLSKNFGGVTAVNHVCFDVFPGEIVGLIGPNGSGKTTIFNCLTGLLESDPGSEIIFNNSNITNKKTHTIAQLGLTRAFQEARIFLGLNVIENLLVSIQQYQEDNLFFRFWNGRSLREYEKKGEERAFELMEFVGLTHHAYTPSRELSYGQRKLLIFAMTIMSKPSLVLLDEPAAAVNLTAIEHIKEYIKKLNQNNITFLIIEHNMEMIMGLCQRIIVLDYGKIIAEGSPREVQSNDEVIDAYFGRE